MLDKTKEDLILNQINELITEKSLEEFLVTLIKSDEVNENLLAICITIEIKYKLLEETHYATIIDEIYSEKLIVNFDNFTGYFKGNNDKILFSCDYETHPDYKPQKYCRVIKFDDYKRFVLGGFECDEDELDFDDTLDITEAAIKEYGWSGNNDIVWVTTLDEIKSLSSKSSDKDYSANPVCDYLGLARTDFPERGFVVIEYSENFSDSVYQPNASNADFTYHNSLFISYNNSNGFGKTYNYCCDEYAKEHIHKKSHYLDNKFVAKYIGKASKDEDFNRDKILDEATARLGV